MHHCNVNSECNVRRISEGVPHVREKRKPRSGRVYRYIELSKAVSNASGSPVSLCNGKCIIYNIYMGEIPAAMFQTTFTCSSSIEHGGAGRGVFFSQEDRESKSIPTIKLTYYYINIMRTAHKKKKTNYFPHAVKKK